MPSGNPRPAAVRNKIALGVLLLAAGAALLVFFLQRQATSMVDFEVNYMAGKRLLWGETLYRAADGHFQFKYPPFAAALYLPLALLPLSVAKGLWFLLSLGAVTSLFVLAYRLLSPPLAVRIAAPLLFARYFLRELELGQINALITAGLMFMAWLLLKREPGPARPADEWKAGALWGLACALKPYALIFLPYFGLKKRLRTLFAGVIVVTATFLLPAAYYGWHGNLTVHQEWIQSLRRSTPPLLASQDNVSLMGFFAKWTGQAGLSTLLYGISLGLLAIFVLLLIARGSGLKQAGRLEACLLLLLIPLVSPLGWDYTFLAAAPALVLVLGQWKEYPPAARGLLAFDLGIISLSLYDLLGRGLYAKFMSLSVVTLCFVLLLFYLGRLRFKRLA